MHSEPPSNVDQAHSRKGKEEELPYLPHHGLSRKGMQLHALLAYLGAKSLGPPETLKECTIGVEALGKHADLDPRIDPTVRVEIAKLRTRMRGFTGMPARPALSILRSHTVPICPSSLVLHPL